MDAIGKIKSVMHVLRQRADRNNLGLPKDQQLWMRLRDAVKELSNQTVEARDLDIENIKRLAGIEEALALPGIEQAIKQGRTDSSPMEQLRQLISGASKALDAGDAGRTKAILRDMYRLTGGTDEGY